MVGPIEPTGAAPSYGFQRLSATPAVTPPPAVHEVQPRRSVEEEAVATRQEPNRAPSSPVVRQTNLNFRIIDNPPLVQARVVDRATDEVLLAVPSDSWLRFSRSFRRNVAEFVGRHLDVTA